MNIKELLTLVGRDGKVVVVGEDGEVKGVFLSYTEYSRLGGATGKQVDGAPGPDPEKINREILEAQLTDNVDLTNKNLETIALPEVGAPSASFSAPSPIKNILARRARDLFVSQPYGRQEPPAYDMREEVVDPTFGSALVYPPVSNVPTASPPPRIEVEADEEIKPNFDDI